MQVMTYQQIQETYRKLYGKTVKSCWIADVRRGMGLTTRVAPNRINPKEIKHSCKDQMVRERIRNIINQKN